MMHIAQQVVRASVPAFRASGGRGRVLPAARAFTLTELLVAMAIIVVIAGVTAVGIRTIARDAKLASATNTIIAALDTARGIAIRDGKHTVVAFRSRLDGNNTFVEVVTAQSVGVVGDMYTGVYMDANGSVRDVVERYVPVSGITPRRLPTGIKIASPLYGGEVDDRWVPVSHLPATAAGEVGGAVIAVMYGPDGRVRMRRDDSVPGRYFIDFNNDQLQQQGEGSFPNTGPGNPFPDNTGYCNFGQGYAFDGSITQLNQFFCQHNADDEPYLTFAPFLAVYDDDRLRDMHDTSTWFSGQAMIDDVSAYVNSHADRIHFNRYTGVVMR